MGDSDVLDIIYYPEKESLLRKSSQQVTVFNEKTHALTHAMMETMKHHQGIGLAGVQVGLLQQIFVMQVPHNEHLPKVFINPKILEKSATTLEYEEGCLSIPEYRAIISRPERLIITAVDENGKPFEIELEGLPAICAQHEIDHLNGKLFIDYLSPLKRHRLRRKMIKNSDTLHQ